MESYHEAGSKAIGAGFGPDAGTDDCFLSGVPSIEVQSGRVTFKRPCLGGSNPRGGRRGRVTEMSNASRFRLMSKFASLDYEALARASVPLWFVTLTTPVEYWDNYKAVYLSLRRFRDSLKNEQAGNGYLGAFVRREIGSKRGMLHYHLVVVGGGLSRREVGRLWTRSLRASVDVRVDVQLLDSPARVSRYLSKYCAKVGYHGKESAERAEVKSGTSFNSAPCASLSKAHNVEKGEGKGGGQYTGGRWWYVWGAELLPWGEVVGIVGHEAKAIAKRFKRLFRRWMVSCEARRVVAAANAGLPVPLYSVFDLRLSRRQLQRRMKFCEHLRRSSSGYTFLLSPDLLQRMLDASCLAIIDSPARFPWEDFV